MLAMLSVRCAVSCGKDVRVSVETQTDSTASISSRDSMTFAIPYAAFCTVSNGILLSVYVCFNPSRLFACYLIL